MAENLEGESGLLHDLARAVAGAVEEKALSLGCRSLTTSLIKELVFNELLVMRQAEKALANCAAEETETSSRLSAEFKHGLGEGKSVGACAAGSG